MGLVPLYEAPHLPDALLAGLSHLCATPPGALDRGVLPDGHAGDASRHCGGHLGTRQRRLRQGRLPGAHSPHVRPSHDPAAMSDFADMLAPCVANQDASSQKVLVVD